jgi:hypothetical protein
MSNPFLESRPAAAAVSAGVSFSFPRGGRRLDPEAAAPAAAKSVKSLTTFGENFRGKPRIFYAAKILC